MQESRRKTPAGSTHDGAWLDWDSKDLTTHFERMRTDVDRLVDEIGNVIVGKEEIVERVVVASLTEGAHILFEDVPGLAKSVLAESFSRATGCKFGRVQFTPDLLPTDITGGHIYDRGNNEFQFRKGPIFTNFLLADEINRASPKTQSALLESMAEKQVSIEGDTHALEPPFMVLATQNPVEQEGTYPLPEAQMDRFMMRLYMGYPTKDEEVEIMRRRLIRKKDEFDVEPAVNRDRLLQMKRLVEEVFVGREVADYIARLVVETRDFPNFEVGASPRGCLALVKLSRAYAAIQGRSFVIPDDVRHFAVPVLAHRCILTSEAGMQGIHEEDVIREVLKEVPVPKKRTRA